MIQCIFVEPFSHFALLKSHKTAITGAQRPIGIVEMAEPVIGDAHVVFMRPPFHLGALNTCRSSTLEYWAYRLILENTYLSDLKKL